MKLFISVSAPSQLKLSNLQRFELYMDRRPGACWTRIVEMELPKARSRETDDRSIMEDPMPEAKVILQETE